MCYGCTMCDACGKVTRMKMLMGMRSCPDCGTEVPGFITECFNCGSHLEYIEPGDATLLAYNGAAGGIDPALVTPTTYVPPRDVYAERANSGLDTDCKRTSEINSTQKPKVKLDFDSETPVDTKLNNSQNSQQTELLSEQTVRKEKESKSGFEEQFDGAKPFSDKPEHSNKQKNYSAPQHKPSPPIQRPPKSIPSFKRPPKNIPRQG